MKLLLISLFCILIGFNAQADCQVLNSNGSVKDNLSDILFLNLTSQNICPSNVFEFKQLLLNDGLKSFPSMVANRGIHNPAFGSFSLFEFVQGSSVVMGRSIAKDELFFGHFTGASSGQVLIDQFNSPGKLMIELIAWDPVKQVYNFYELIGGQPQPTWFYRGDSLDALKDSSLLHLQPDPNSPQFGTTMRCSACHTSGGPIMKEIKLPHNDWWTEQRPLGFGQNKPSAQLNQWLAELVDAADFSETVKMGINKLNSSKTYQTFKAQSSLRQQLKPLFCTTEINLVSDQDPLESSTKQIRVPSEYWVNPLLAELTPVNIDKNTYIQLLLKNGFRFPEINRIDADHAWLAPVKGFSDIKTIEDLLSKNIVDKEFVADVLAIDFNNPLFSGNRCQLLKLIPEKQSTFWIQQFVKALQESHSSAAKQLLSNIVDSNRTAKFHQLKALEYLNQIKQSMTDHELLETEILRLQVQRLSVFKNEISQNPLGQILEPGFRVIFPMQR